jgi:hypothetical protein
MRLLRNQCKTLDGNCHDSLKCHGPGYIYDVSTGKWNEARDPRETALPRMEGTMRLAALILGTCAAASAQVLIDASEAAALLRHVDPLANASLRCETTPVAPVLGFSLRFQTGYQARVPLSQFHGPGHRISVLVRIAPEASDGKPVYLLRSFDLPDVPDTEFVAEFAGSFLVGQGSYHSSAIVLDDVNRVCRADWRIEVKSGRYERNWLSMQPNTVEPIDAGASGATIPDLDAKFNRLTIFLHAAPLIPGTSKLLATDVLTAVDSLVALLDQIPARSVRLVLFNLDQERELYRNEGFTARDVEQVTRVLDKTQLALVDYRVLRQPQGQAEMLRALIHREVNEANRSDAVIFLGPDRSVADKAATAAADAHAPGRHFFYLQYESAQAWFTGTSTATSMGMAGDPRPKYPCQEWPCSIIPSQSLATPTQAPESNMRKASDPGAIAIAIRKLKGRVLVVRTPADFAKAVDQIGGRGR